MFEAQIIWFSSSGAIGILLPRFVYKFGLPVNKACKKGYRNLNRRFREFSLKLMHTVDSLDKHRQEN